MRVGSVLSAVSSTSAVRHGSRLMEALSWHFQAPDLEAVASLYTSTRMLISFEEILLRRVVKLQHGAEIGCLSFLITVDCALVAAVDVPIDARPLIADLLISLCVGNVLPLRAS